MKIIGNFLSFVNEIILFRILNINESQMNKPLLLTTSVLLLVVVCCTPLKDNGNQDLASLKLTFEFNQKSYSTIVDSNCNCLYTPGSMFAYGTPNVELLDSSGITIRNFRASKLELTMPLKVGKYYLHYWIPLLDTARCSLQSDVYYWMSPGNTKICYKYGDFNFKTIDTTEEIVVGKKQKLELLRVL